MPSPSSSDNGNAIASPNIPPPIYIPLGPTIMLAVFIENVTLKPSGSG